MAKLEDEISMPQITKRNSDALPFAGKGLVREAKSNRNTKLDITLAKPRIYPISFGPIGAKFSFASQFFVTQAWLQVHASKSLCHWYNIASPEIREYGAFK